MRKFVLTQLVVLISVITVNAQIKKGVIVTGGSIGYSQSKQNTNPNDPQHTAAHNFSVAPVFGKTIKQNLVVGGDITYGNFRNKTAYTNSVTDQKYNSFGAGVFIRPYKNLGSSGFYLFVQSRLGVSVNNGKMIYTYINSPGGNTDYKTNGFELGLDLNPGISYAVTPKMQIETSLNNLFRVGYSSSSYKYDQPQSEKNKSSNFDAGIGLGSYVQWSLGVKFFFGA